MENFTSYDSIILSQIMPPDWISPLERGQFDVAITKLNEVKELIDRAVGIQKLINLPIIINQALEAYKNDFVEKTNKLIIKGTGSDEVLQKLRGGIQDIDRFYNECLSVSSSDNRFLRTIAVVLTYDDSKLINSRSSILLADLEKTKIDVENLISQLQKQAKEIVITDYARIFEIEEEKNKAAATRWLIFSGVLSVIFITVIICSLTNDWFKISEKIVEAGSTRTYINYPNLISKVFFLSFLIFIVTFSFRQYSINKNLETTNNHRKNALNSYKLFGDSFSKDDHASRSAIMIQVAKAIFDHNRSGYLSAKNSDTGSPSFLELTKIFSDSKTT